ncbi:MAG: FABP family protein [Deltaproteobacteria bacterium]|nr:FABP family protein [Deltaproteobacteria bacterium]
MDRTRITDLQEIRKNLESLVGKWAGEGRGIFSTIDDFLYREVFEVTSRNPEEAAVHYHQQTWIRRDDGGDGRDSHWESGFILALDDGRVEILNAQESRRVEVLVGEMYSLGEGAWVIEVSSSLHGHDPRMVATSRSIRFEPKTLRYRVGMATTNVQDIQAHLTATLRRVE